MVTFATIIFCILGGISLLTFWGVCESDSSSETGCTLILAALFGIIISGIGLYYCGTLIPIIEAIW